MTDTEAQTRYRVRAEYVSVRTATVAGIVPSRGGYAVVGLYRGAILPPDVSAEQIDHLQRQGLIEAVE